MSVDREEIALVVQDLAQEELCAIVLRFVKECFWIIFLNDLTLIHENHSVGDLARETHFMGHHKHCHPVTSQFDHHIKNFLDHFRIES